MRKLGQGYTVAAGWMLAIAGLFALFGLYRALSYGESDQVVGGDAYSMQILATRGVGFIGVGIVFALFAVVFMLLAVWESTTKPAPILASAAAAPSVVQSPGATRQIICWNCGKRYPAESTSCPHCGKAKAMSPIYA